MTDFESEIPMIRVPFMAVHGDLLLASGDESGARTEYDKAREAASGIEQRDAGRPGRPASGATGSWAGMSRSEAEELHHRALAVFHRDRLLPDVAESLEDLAGTAIDAESTSEAARLFGAASSIRASIGLVPPTARRAGDTNGTSLGRPRSR